MMQNNREILILIDGNALLYRSFHGIPELRTKDKVLVNAVYGFANSILIAIARFKPKYLAVTFDVGKKTFRNDVYKEYKATRKETPDELIPQFRLAREFCKALNIATYGKPNYEADDVIGTITKKIQNSKYKIQTIIVTGDMDTLQLINEHVSVFSVSRGIKKAEIYNTNKVLEKYGFLPDKIVDYKALRGDPSDNIPGVLGIGEKTATNLIKQFHNIENLYDKISNFQEKINKKIPNSKLEISNKIIEKLILNKEKAFLSKKLATICQDAPMEFKLEDTKVHDYDEKFAKKFLDKLEFKSLIPKLPQSIPNHKQNSLF